MIKQIYEMLTENEKVDEKFWKGQLSKKVRERNSKCLSNLKRHYFFFYTKASILLHENIFGNMITTPYPSIWIY